MRTPPDRAALTAYHAELAAAFARRRCACGAPACIVCIGSDAAPDVHWCVPCAPWMVDNAVGCGDRSVA